MASSSENGEGGAAAVAGAEEAEVAMTRCVGSSAVFLLSVTKV
jgi:hypothetical protein